MSTRGSICLAFDDQLIGTYNHSDSYPSWLGRVLGTWVAELDDIALELVKEQARRIKLVDDQDTPTPEEAAPYAEHMRDVGAKPGEDWYSILRGLQGDLPGYLEAGIMPTGGVEFCADSLFCEWAYVIDLNLNVIEVYKGFNKSPAVGRFAHLPVNEHNGFGPVTRIGTVPFAISGTENFWSALERAVESDEVVERLIHAAKLVSSRVPNSEIF